MASKINPSKNENFEKKNESESENNLTTSHMYEKKSSPTKFPSIISIWNKCYFDLFIHLFIYLILFYFSAFDWLRLGQFITCRDWDEVSLNSIMFLQTEINLQESCAVNIRYWSRSRAPCLVMTALTHCKMKENGKEGVVAAIAKVNEGGGSGVEKVIDVDCNESVGGSKKQRWLSRQ